MPPARSHAEPVCEYKQLMDAQGGYDVVSAFKQGFASSQGTYNPFYLGQVSMMFTAQWNTWWVKRYRPDVDYGVVPLPCPASHLERAGSAWLGGNFDNSLPVRLSWRHPCCRIW